MSLRIGSKLLIVVLIVISVLIGIYLIGENVQKFENHNENANTNYDSEQTDFGKKNGITCDDEGLCRPNLLVVNKDIDVELKKSLLERIENYLISNNLIDDPYDYDFIMNEVVQGDNKYYNVCYKKKNSDFLYGGCLKIYKDEIIELGEYK
ncbi:MAG: hypothetical protein KKF44_00915 [Nanoarchaeota archaeon]|nr:hypothetical protein [Nanoarchaeota archaeon]